MRQESRQTSMVRFNHLEEEDKTLTDPAETLSLQTPRTSFCVSESLYQCADQISPMTETRIPSTSNIGHLVMDHRLGTALALIEAGDGKYRTLARRGMGRTLATARIPFLLNYLKRSTSDISLHPAAEGSM